MAHAFSAAARRIGQPAVVGQLVAGIALGPSALGAAAPAVSRAVFPAGLMPTLGAIAELAVIMFLLGVGYELDLPALVAGRRTVSRVAAVAFALPFGAGTLGALAFRGRLAGLGLPHGASPGVLLFLGVCVSVTAVPVLAALVRDNGLAGSVPGQAALAAAGIIDLLSWIALAVALLQAGRGPALPGPVRLGLGAAYLAGMLLVARPLLALWARRFRPGAGSRLPVYVAFGLASAWVTSELGVQVIFGALLAGACLPREPDRTLDADVVRAIDGPAALLLPFFFVYSGLSVRVASLNWAALAVLAAVCVLAFVTKIGGGTAGALAARQPPRTALTIGVLLSTRGLTELIALNAGLQAGLIGTRLYTVLVIMAVLTTLATQPLLSLLRRCDRAAAIWPPGPAEAGRGIGTTAPSAPAGTA